METKPVASAVIEHNGKYLFGRKPKGVGPYPDTWHILGGKIKPGESPLDAVKREVFEESGIEIENIHSISAAEDTEPDKHGVPTHYIFNYFSAKYKSGELRPGDDIAELKWFPKDSLKNMDLNGPSIKLFREMGLI